MERHLHNPINIPIFQKLLRGEIGYSYIDPAENQTLLHIACDTNDEYFARYLCRFLDKIDIDARDLCGQTALFIAVTENNHSIVRLLVQHNADPDISDIYYRAPLYISINRSFEISKMLVHHGANLYGCGYIAMCRDYRTVELILDNNSDETPSSLDLIWFCHLNNEHAFDIVRLLLERGADPYGVDVDGYTALEVAVYEECPAAHALLFYAYKDPHPLIKVFKCEHLIDAAVRWGESTEFIIHCLLHGANPFHATTLCAITEKAKRSWTPARHATSYYAIGFLGQVRAVLTAYLVADIEMPLELVFLILAFLRRFL